MADFTKVEINTFSRGTVCYHSISCVPPCVFKTSNIVCSNVWYIPLEACLCFIYTWMSNIVHEILWVTVFFSSFFVCFVFSCIHGDFPPWLSIKMINEALKKSYWEKPASLFIPIESQAEFASPGVGPAIFILKFFRAENRTGLIKNL